MQRDDHLARQDSGSSATVMHPEPH
jgi:hypothetical protein